MNKWLVVLAISSILFVGGCANSASPISPAFNTNSVQSPQSKRPLILVSNYSVSGISPEIDAYDISANGDASPIIRLGASSRVAVATGLAFDSLGRLFACCGVNGVNVYAPDLSNGAQPIAVIGCPNDGFSGSALTVSPSGDVYLSEIPDAPGLGIQWVESGATGCVNVHTIGGPHTDLNTPQELAVDSKGQVYAADGAADFGQPGVSVYAPEVEGDAVPLRFITGPHTGFFHGTLWGVALNNNGLIYVLSGDYSDPGAFLSVFNADACGDVAPLRVQKLVGVSYPSSIAVDKQNLLYVTDYSNAINVYDGNAVSNTSLEPLRTIRGPHTGLNSPVFITLRDT